MLKGVHQIDALSAFALNPFSTSPLWWLPDQVLNKTHSKCIIKSGNSVRAEASSLVVQSDGGGT